MVNCSEVSVLSLALKAIEGWQLCDNDTKIRLSSLLTSPRVALFGDGARDQTQNLDKDKQFPLSHASHSP